MWLQIQTLSSLNTELQDTLQTVNEELLSEEALSKAAAEEREYSELSQAKTIVLLEKENLLLEKKLHEAHDANTESLSNLASVKLKVYMFHCGNK